MHYLIFDIDGTLTKSTEFDTVCYKLAVLSHIDITFRKDWGDYEHVTDSGILIEILKEHGLLEQAEHIKQKIKDSFIKSVRAYAETEGVTEVEGAAGFINKLKIQRDICIGIATGGWGETAKLKLGWNFVQVGNCTNHHQTIDNFIDYNKAMVFCGL